MTALPRRLLLGAALVPTLSGLRAARAQEAVLDMAVAAPPSSVDPHFYTLTPNMALAAHLFDTLIRRDPQGRMVPGLAESWKRLDDSRWEFALRRGVRFHNGEEFSARDVAYTLERVPKVVNSPGSFNVYTRAITRVEVVDSHTIRFHTQGLYPLLPGDLSQVSILWHGLGENPSTGDFNNGRNAIGTGPFRLVAFRSGDRVEMLRNDDYWGERPVWSKVVYRIIPNNGARVAALQAGDVAFIDNVPTSDRARLRGETRLRLSEVTSLRSVYLRTDFRTESPYVSGPNGEPIRNPMTDLRVRRALSVAINRAGIAERIMSGAATPTGQMMPEGSYGHVPDIPVPAFDVDAAKALLAEAGLADGFTVTLLASNDRYINDAQIAQSIGQMWSRIGVKTNVETMPFAVVAQRGARQDTSISMGGWANSAGEPSAGLRGLFGTRDMQRGWGTVNNTGFSNADYDRVLGEALTTADDAAREKKFQEATRIAVREAAWIPLHIQKCTWGMKQGLVHTPRADEMTLAMDIRPA
ncbi:ABC transporter substrate-binding protein [Roseomonas sp. USHLN139]|uniref:ABC transporter substrate-binding protein n=1 Tax=Roseomonas sp. USHLN139 TaxID=3081298 RepID=UPI003B01AF27